MPRLLPTADCPLDFHFDDIVPAGGAVWGEVCLVGLPAVVVFGGKVYGASTIALVDGIHDLHKAGITLICNRLFFRAAFSCALVPHSATVRPPVRKLPGVPR